MTYLEEVSSQIVYEANIKFDEWMHKLIRQDAIILTGRYAGRRGKITSLSLHPSSTYPYNLELAILVQPYKIIRRGKVNEVTKELLWDPIEARQYRSPKQVELVLDD